MADDDQRLDEALRALESVEPVRRWDDVVARASSGVTPLETAPVRGRRTARWLLAAAAVVVMAMAAGSAALSLRDEDDGEPLEVGGPPTTASTSVIRTPCGRIAVDGDVGWFAYAPVEPRSPGREPDDLRSFTIDGAVVRTPGDVVIDFVGERAEGVETAHATAVAWYRSDGVLELRITPPSVTPECPVVSIEVTGDDDAADLATAIRVANELRFVDADTTRVRSQAEVEHACADHRLVSDTPPDGFPLSAGADGGPWDAGDGRSIELRPDATSSLDNASSRDVGGLRVTSGTLDGDPAAIVDIADGCRLLLVAHGVAATELDALLSTARLIDADRVPVLLVPAIWPETAPSQVDRRLPESWRDDPVATAEAFAHLVLGWDDAVAEGGLVAPDGSRQITTTVHRRPDEDLAITVRLAPSLGGRWWSVVYVNTVEEGTASVQVAGSMASAGAGPPPGTVSTTVRWEYGGRVVEVDGAAQPVDLGFTPETPGSVVVLFEAAAGDVIGAWGAALPAGDFAAG